MWPRIFPEAKPNRLGFLKHSAPRPRPAVPPPAARWPLSVASASNKRPRLTAESSESHFPAEPSLSHAGVSRHPFPLLSLCPGSRPLIIFVSVYTCLLSYTICSGSPGFIPYSSRHREQTHGQENSTHVPFRTQLPQRGHSQSFALAMFHVLERAGCYPEVESEAGLPS